MIYNGLYVWFEDGSVLTDGCCSALDITQCWPANDIIVIMEAHGVLVIV